MNDTLVRFARANGFDHLSQDALLAVAGPLDGGTTLEQLAGLDGVAALPRKVVISAVRAHKAYDRFQSLCRQSPLAFDDALACSTPGHLAAANVLHGEDAKGDVARLATTLVGVALKEAVLMGKGDSEAARAQSGRWPATSVPPARWLAWRRLEKNGEMALSMRLAEDARQTLLQSCADSALEIATLLEAAQAGLWQTLDDQAQHRAEDEACAAFYGLLSAPPVDASPLGTIYIGSPRGPMGAAVVSQDGRLQDARSFPPGKGMEPFLEWTASTRASVWVIPTSAPDARRLGRVRTELPGTLHQVKPAGVKLALDDLELDAALFERPPEILKAVVLARRALQPHLEWRRLDPLELGLAEYQNDLDAASLGAALAAVRVLAPKGEHTATTVRAQRRLNPMIRSLADLRPGMELDVQVTNITSFGAFATFGLPIEGLIHISELSDQRVNSPSDVVRIGQQLRARILQVEADRRRVSLTLRSGPARPRSSGGGGASKADALSRLNDLFKD